MKNNMNNIPAVDVGTFIPLVGAKFFSCPYSFLYYIIIVIERFLNQDNESSSNSNNNEEQVLNNNSQLTEYSSVFRY